MDASLAVVYAGTPGFAVPALEAIAASRHRIKAVYTQPDRPAGRGQKPASSPVKERASALGLPVEQPATLRDAGAAARLATLAPDVMVVAAYGLLLPQAVLDLPRLGCINIHASLLPRWRGAAPIARAIEAGDAMTGVCIMRMEATLDTGPVMLRKELAIGPTETAGELEARLAKAAVPLLIEALAALVNGSASFQPQDASQATWAQKLDKSEARLNWRESAELLARRVRAFQPWPVAETTLDGKTLRIHESAVVAATEDAVPGTILRTDAEGLIVMTGQQGLAIRRLQLPGRRTVTAADFANTRPLTGLVLV